MLYEKDPWQRYNKDLTNSCKSLSLPFMYNLLSQPVLPLCLQKFIYIIYMYIYTHREDKKIEDHLTWITSEVNRHLGLVLVQFWNSDYVSWKILTVKNQGRK